MTQFIFSRPVLDQLRLIDAMGPRALDRFLADMLRLSQSGGEQPAAANANARPGAETKTFKPEGGRSLVRFELPGYSGSAETQIGALAEILRRLSKGQDDFLSLLAKRVEGRTRKHIARRPADVHPLGLDLGRDAIELVPGWYIGRNIAYREKLQILEAACQLAGLRLGKDVRITSSQ